MQRPPANWPTRYWPWSTVADKERTFPTAIIAEPFAGAAPPFGSKDEDDDDDGKCAVCGHDPCTCESAEASYYTWGTFALDALPESLTDEPGEHDAAVDHSEDGEARDTSTAITAEPFPGAAPPFGSKDDPDEGTLDPADEDEDEDEDEDTSVKALTLTGPYTAVTSEGKQVSLKWLAMQECLVGNCIGFMTNALRTAIAEQGITSPISKLPPAPPGAAEKAKKKTKLGRGIEGDGDEGIDPMSTLDKFNWDNLPLPGMGQI